ncbi:hypothetical protein BH24ACT22_BH24ACT22_10330 [soil metagenome]
MFGKHFRRWVGPLILVVFLAAACGEENSTGPTGEDTGQTTATAATTSGGSSGETTAAMAETTAEENAYNPNAEIGPKEEANMMPADGKKPDKPQPLPQNPPEGVKTYPANGNKLVNGKIEYDRDPPTNGKHSPIWQNCGFYSEPVDKKTTVHSLDHGVVWISYRPDLPTDQIEQLSPYGDEKYVIVSPYPGLPAPVVATAWRNQIYLDGADDPRLREFVDEFRISELAPLSGNRCVAGVGKPDA